MNQIQAALDFDARPRRVRTSDTSRAAQASAEPKAGTKRALLLAFIRGRGAEGATDEEIQMGRIVAEQAELETA